MKNVFVLLVFFLAIGVFARSYNRKVRMIMSVGIIAVFLYLYVSLYIA